MSETSEREGFRSPVPASDGGFWCETHIVEHEERRKVPKLTGPDRAADHGPGTFGSFLRAQRICEYLLAPDSAGCKGESLTMARMDLTTDRETCAAVVVIVSLSSSDGAAGLVMVGAAGCFKEEVVVVVRALKANARARAKAAATVQLRVM